MTTCQQGTPNEAPPDSIASLRAEFSDFQKSTVEEIRNLKTEVNRLTKELEEQRRTSRINSQKQNEETPMKQYHGAAAPTVDHKENTKNQESAKPLTYKEAFESIGGTAELSKYRGLSQELEHLIVDTELESELKLLLPRDYTRRRGFSTVLVNQPYVRNLEELYENANRVYSDFDAAIRHLSETTGSRAVVPPMKGEVRARMKALFKYRDDSGTSTAADERIAWYRLTDLIRATLEFSTLADMYSGLKTVLDYFGHDVVRELNDRYQNPISGDYRDVQCVIDFQGHMCELQLNTEPMLRAKMTTGHRDFEVVRELRAAVADGNLLRVVNSLEFARDHLGTTTTTATAIGDDEGEIVSPLAKLLRSQSARTLLHDAASRGHADIVHALLLYGADVNIQDDDHGDTALHLAVFGGHERCVWVLLDVGRPDLSVKNHDGQTALVKGYLMLWKRPAEPAVRAVSTLAQVAGVDAVKAARAAVDDHVRRRLKPSRQLVDFAAVGNVGKMKDELADYADPNSRDKGGQSALEAAVVNGQSEALELLLDFKVKVTSDLLARLSAESLRKHCNLIEFLCDEASLSNVQVVNGMWPRGVLGMVALADGVEHLSDRHYCWKNVPCELQSIRMTKNPCHSGAGLELRVCAFNETIGVLIGHGAKNEYGVDTFEAFTVQLTELGFSRTIIPQMYTNSFPNDTGADLWQLSPPKDGHREVSLTTKGDFEFNLCFSEEPVHIPCTVKILAGAWGAGFLSTARLTEGVCQYTDRQYKWQRVPKELLGVAMTVNPCHAGRGMKLQITTDCAVTLGILIGHGARSEYKAGHPSFCQRLQELGFAKVDFPEMSTNSYPIGGVALWKLSLEEPRDVVLLTEEDMEFNICYFPSS